MQVSLWKETLIKELHHQVGHRKDILEDIFSCYEEDILSHQFSSSDVSQIATKLGIQSESWDLSQVKWDLVKEKYFSGTHYIPEQFRFLAGTHMSSVRGLIAFFDSRFNQNASQHLIDRLDLHQDVLLNDQIKVNNHFINKMFEIMLDDFNLSKFDIDLMSIFVHRYSMRSSILKMVNNCKTNADILNLMHNNIAKYELNNQYSLEHQGENSFITSSSRYPIDSTEGRLCLMKDPLLYFKISTIMHITSLMGREPIKIGAHETLIENGHQIFRIKVLDTNQLSRSRNEIIH